MSIVCPDVGEVELLEVMLNKQAQTNVVLKLYSNNYTPVESTSLGDITEQTAVGYSAITLTGANWTVTTSLGVSSASYATQTFTMTNATTYGYFVCNSGGDLLWLEKLPSAIIIGGGGGTTEIMPIVSLE